MATEVGLNTEILHNQDGTYSSLTELNGIPLFTNDFGELIEIHNKNEKQQENELLQQAMQQQATANKDEDPLEQYLFQREAQPNDIREINTKENLDGVLYPIVGIVFVIFLCAMIFYSRRRRQKTEAKKKEIERSYNLG